MCIRDRGGAEPAATGRDDRHEARRRDDRVAGGRLVVQVFERAVADPGRDGGQPIGAGDTLTRVVGRAGSCLLYTSPSPRDRTRSRMPSSA